VLVTILKVVTRFYFCVSLFSLSALCIKPS
jgi:hypothetical protein